VAGPKNSSLSLIDSNGSISATIQVEPPPFQAHALMAWTSATRDALYYLNGGSEIRVIGPGGSHGAYRKITLGAYEQAGIAVSPDPPARIAVSIFSYAPPPASTQGLGLPTYTGMRLYVEDLQGGNRVEIFASTTVAEFPIAWVRGRLVLAVSGGLCCQATPVNPYAATSYHVVDPATGNRLASICEKTDGPEGPVEPGGTICARFGLAPDFQNWDGGRFGAPAAVPNPSQYLNAIAPDASRVAVGGEPIRVWGPQGADRVVGGSGFVFGWLDVNRIVIQQKGASALSVLDVANFDSAQLSATGSYLGTFPTRLA
jgi:hypothetical protein